MEFGNYVVGFLRLIPIVLLTQLVFLFIFKKRKELVYVIFGFVLLVMVNHFIFTQMNHITEHFPSKVKWWIVLLVVTYIGFFKTLYDWIKVMKRTPSEP